MDNSIDCSFLCSTIHKTALILLPFAFWGYLPVRNSKFISVAFAVIAMLAFSSTTFIGDIYVYFLQFESIVDYGIAYGYDEGIISLSMICILFLCLLLYIIL